MNSNKIRLTDRRTFIRKCLRFGAGGGLVMIGAFLGFRKESPKDNNTDCTLKNPCQGCSKYQGCTLPRAEEFRLNKREI
jgi:hypothetical protein